MTVKLSKVSKGTFAASLLAVALFASGCATIKTGAHYDETNNFGRYETFAWIDQEPLITGAAQTGLVISPLTREKVKQALRDGFERIGYEFTDDAEKADFVVAYTIGTRQEVSVRSYPDAYHGTWGWHVQGSHYYVNEITTHNYTKGALGVDVFDQQTRKPVWHGFAEKTITTIDKKDPTPSIQAGVRKMLASFPK